MKHIQPALPIVMLVDHLDFPSDALKSVDALVVKSDGIHFLLATVHFVLTANRLTPPASAPAKPRSASTASALTDLAIHNQDAPFSPKVWQHILSGTFQI